MSRTWKRLAEALGINAESGINWRRVNQKHNMRRWGTEFASKTDRAGKSAGDPMAMYRRQRDAQARAGKPIDMTPRPGGIGAPDGTDRPGQGNPLFDPPGRSQRPVASLDDGELDDFDLENEG